MELRHALTATSSALLVLHFGTATATASTLDISPSGAPTSAVGQPASAGPEEAELPHTGGATASATTDAGTLTMGAPAEGPDLAASDAVSRFEGTAPGTEVVVQDTAAGLRALVRIESPAAPERFEFPIGGDVARLSLLPDGGVIASDADGGIVAVAAPPWAADAHGVAVPTHLELSGTTLVQIVEHRAGNYAYGITADPDWLFWVKCGAALALFVAKNLPPTGALRLGNVVKSATNFVRFLKQYRSAKAAAANLAAFIGSASGVDTVVYNCWPG